MGRWTGWRQATYLMCLTSYLAIPYYMPARDAICTGGISNPT
nr:MAG TPA: hypothetical protein [Caudoviricetes sp.]